MYIYLDIQPNKTYATAENAKKAFDKAMVKYTGGTKILFRVAIVATPEGRFFPLIYNTTDRDESLQVAIWSGFNVIN